MTTNAAGHIQVSRDFLRRSRQYLADGDLHQAAEKGWGAAAHLMKAVAASEGWEYEHHDQFDMVVQNASQRFRQPSVRQYGNSAHFLHRSFYRHPDFLQREAIGQHIDDVEKMVDALEPFVT